MTRYVRRAIHKPFNPDYPLLYKPRAFKEGDDARWRGVQLPVVKLEDGEPFQIFQIVDRLDVLRHQQQNR